LNYKREKIPLKSRILVGVSAAILNGGGLAFWDYFSEEPLHFQRYVFQGVVMGLFFLFLFRNKVIKE